MAQSETAKKIETPTADSSTLAAKIDAAKTDAVTPAVPAPAAAKVTAKVKRPSLRYRLYHFLFDVHGDHSIAQTFEQWLAILIIALQKMVPYFRYYFDRNLFS